MFVLSYTVYVMKRKVNIKEEIVCQATLNLFNYFYILVYNILYYILYYILYILECLLNIKATA